MNADQAADSLRITYNLPPFENTVSTLARGLVGPDNTVAFFVNSLGAVVGPTGNSLAANGGPGSFTTLASSGDTSLGLGGPGVNPRSGFGGNGTQNLFTFQHGSGATICYGNYLAFSTTDYTAADVFIRSDGANVLALRNATAGQSMRFYNTWTNSSNYERAFIRWSSNVLEIGSEALGTGTQRLTKILYSTSGNVFDFVGTGTPEAVVTAGIGSTFRRTNGGAATSFYVKESGTGNTGWVAK